MSNGEYLSTKQVAQLLFVVDSRVRQLALSGALPAKKVGRGWVFVRREVEAFALRPRHVGRPRLDALR